MSQTRRKYRQAAYDKSRKPDGRKAHGGYTNEYVYGNTVRKLEPQKRLKEVPVKKPQHEVRKNRDKARHMSAGYVLFLAAALCTSAVILVNYLRHQSELTNLTESVAAKQSQLNDLRTSNNEEYNRIINSIDLEEIKRIAMSELGMIYAQEGQVIEYEGKSNDYMRQAPEGSH